MAGKSTFSHDKADAVCEKLMEGRSLHSICKDKSLPSVGTVMKWLRENPSFSQQYAHAREAQAELMGDKMVEFALEMPENADWQRVKMQMDAIKWAAGKLKPVKYGEANILKRRTDRQIDEELVNITPEEEVNPIPRDKKQLARVIWYMLNSPDEAAAE